MLTAVLYLVLALAVGGVLFFVSVAIFGGAVPPDPEAADGALEPAAGPAPARADLVSVAADTVPVTLPEDRRMSAPDVDALRLPVALRGYRMADTDKALDRLARELRERDEELAALRRELAQCSADEPPEVREPAEVREAPQVREPAQVREAPEDAEARDQAREEAPASE